MKHGLILTLGCSLFLTICETDIVVAQSPIGQFQNHADLRSPLPAGEAIYNENGPWTYQVKSGGTDGLWSGHALYSEISGDFTFSATVYAEDQFENTREASGVAGIVVSNSYYLDALNLDFYSLWLNSYDKSAQAMILVNYPAVFLDPIPANRQDGRFEITRKGDTLETYCWDKTNNTKMRVCSDVIPMMDPVYVMLIVNSGSTGKSTIGYFKDVQIIPHQTSVNNWPVYQ